MFLFIAYKDSSSDYARGCLMATYSPDHVVENMLTADQLVNRWAAYLHMNLNLDHSETGYEFWIFKDGIKVFDGTSSHWDGWQEIFDCAACQEAKEAKVSSAYEFCKEHTEALELQEKKDLAEIEQLYIKAKSLAQEMQQKQEDEKRQQISLAAHKQLEYEKEQRRLQFEKLKREFDAS